MSSYTSRDEKWQFVVFFLKGGFFIFRPLMYLYWEKYILEVNQILYFYDCHRGFFPWRSYFGRNFGISIFWKSQNTVCLMGADTFSPGVRKVLTLSFIFMGMPHLGDVWLCSYGILKIVNIRKIGNMVHKWNKFIANLAHKWNKFGIC